MIYVDKKALILHEKDNVANTITDVAPGNPVIILPDNTVVVALDGVPFGFKIAVKDIFNGAPVYKYGQKIGKAIKDIAEGQCVHVNNMAGFRGRGDQAEEKEPYEN